MGLKIIEDGADSNKLNMNRMKPESTKVHDKIRADSARRRRKELMEGAEDSKWMINCLKFKIKIT